MPIAKGSLLNITRHEGGLRSVLHIGDRMVTTHLAGDDGNIKNIDGGLIAVRDKSGKVLKVIYKPFRRAYAVLTEKPNEQALAIVHSNNMSQPGKKAVEFIRLHVKQPKIAEEWSVTLPEPQFYPGSRAVQPAADGGLYFFGAGKTPTESLPRGLTIIKLKPNRKLVDKKTDVTKFGHGACLSTALTPSKKVVAVFSRWDQNSKRWHGRVGRIDPVVGTYTAFSFDNSLSARPTSVLARGEGAFMAWQQRVGVYWIGKVTALAADGKPVWTRTVTAPGWDTTHSIDGFIQLADGRLAIGGEARSPSATRAFFAVTDPWGHASCKLAGPCATKPLSFCPSKSCENGLCK